MADLLEVADALAAAYGTITANGETVTATARLPNSVGKLALLVYPPSGVLDVGVGRVRSDEWDFPVRLLRDPLTLPERTAALYAWLTATRDLIETPTNITLGLDYVSWARVIGATVEIDGESYAQNGKFVRWDVIDYTVRVHLSEPIT